MRKGKIKLFLIVWILLLWTIRIINVNQRAVVESVEISMRETFGYNGLSITALEAHLYSIPEFEAALDAEVEAGDDEFEIVCVKFRIKNETGKALGWNKVMDEMGYGFETLTWYSAIDPFLGAKINFFSLENLESGGEAEAWYATQVMKECFHEKNWKKLDENEFYYVMDLYPNPVKVKLEIREET